MRAYWLLLSPLAVALGNMSDAAAQAFPSRAITMVVPYSAGGQSDTVARIVAEHMRTSLGQPIIVENVSGAGGRIAVERVAGATPDGHVLILGTQSQFVYSGAIETLPYDPVNDFAPIALVASSPHLVLARPDVPAKDLAELITWINANQNKVSQGHVGLGGAPYLCAIEMQNRIGARWTLVPYRGGSLAMQDLVAGHIDLYCSTPGTALAMVRTGMIKVYAIAGEKRLAAAPDIPTADEAGLPGLHIPTWHGLWAPKGTPKVVIDKLNAAVRGALADRAVATRLAEIGIDVPAPAQQTPEALGTFQRDEIEKWWPIIQAAHIRPY